MLKPVLAFIAALALAGSPGVWAAPQSGRVRPADPGAHSEGDDDTIRLRTEEVLVPISVQTRSGHLPGKLEIKDLIVTEDERRQQITSILRTPANILLIIDTSGDLTTLKNINVYRDLAVGLIDLLGDTDKAAIMTYSETPQVVSSWTTDRAQLKRALGSNFKPAAASHLYETLAYAADSVLTQVPGRRSVVLITDGVDSVAQGAFASALEAIQRARATAYVITDAPAIIRELKHPGRRSPSPLQRIDPVARKMHQLLQEYSAALEAGEEPMRKLAEETGGRLWNPQDPIRCSRPDDPQSSIPPERFEDCRKLTTQAFGEIASEYVVSYTTQRKVGDTAFHAIQAYSTRTDLQIRMRRGIYSSRWNIEPRKQDVR